MPVQEAPVRISPAVLADEPDTAEDVKSARGRSGSLKPVLDILPASVYDNPTWKGMSYFGRDMVFYLAAATALVFVTNVFAALALDVVASVFVLSLFIVAHDCAHNALFSSKRVNSWVGHIAMLPGWHVYEGWVLGHNRVHHGFTVRQGYDFVWHPVTPEEFKAMPARRRLLHRVEWSWAGAGLYYMHQVWWAKMVVGKPPSRWAKSIRKDRWFVAGFVALMAGGLGVLAGAETHSVAGVVWMLARVMVLPFLGFSYMAGSFVHVHHVQPDIRWWKRSEWTKFKGQMEGTTILRAPKGANFLLHWIMVHVPHHVDMRIPMYNLEAAAAAIEAAFPGTVHDGPLRFSDFVKSSRACKLYDFDAGRWMTYAEGAAFLATEQLPVGVSRAV
jgi:omega-6 fatty acid desaturase (delta-12 desaturase)